MLDVPFRPAVADWNMLLVRQYRVVEIVILRTEDPDVTGFGETLPHYTWGRVTLIRDKTETVLLETDENSKYMNREIAHFLDCITDASRPQTDDPDSLQGLRVIWRLYEAEDRGGMADLRGLSLKQS